MKKKKCNQKPTNTTKSLTINVDKFKSNHLFLCLQKWRNNTYLTLA